MKTYIDPETLDTVVASKTTDLGLLDGYVEMEVYIRNLQNVIGEIIEDAEDSFHVPMNKTGIAKVTWISLNKAKRLVKGELK